MKQTVLILGGNGKIGTHAAPEFEKAGWDVRHYDRKSDDMTKAAMGVDVIVNGLNPPNYKNWAVNIPNITKQVIAAAKASGATVIIPGNIYNYGLVNGVIDENTPHAAHTKKGRIRIQMEEAYRRAGVQTIILRAGNFIDPYGNGDIMSLFILRAIAKGKVTTGGDPSIRQAYAYVPDWARGAVALAEKRESLSMFEDVPFPGHTFSISELAAELGKATDRNIKITNFPWWLMTALSPALEVARELREMRYLYEMDHKISGRKFSEMLPDFMPTPTDQVMRAGLGNDINPNQSVRSSSQSVIAN